MNIATKMEGRGEGVEEGGEEEGRRRGGGEGRRRGGGGGMGGEGKGMRMGEREERGGRRETGEVLADAPLT